MYFTSGSDRAFEQLMQTRPGADHFDSGEAGAPEGCGTCRFYRPHWKYQFCVYEECPYQPGKLTALDGAVKFQVKGVDDEMAVFRVEKNRGYTVMSNHHPAGTRDLYPPYQPGADRRDPGGCPGAGTGGLYRAFP